jgi:hypothetical protein
VKYFRLFYMRRSSDYPVVFLVFICNMNNLNLLRSVGRGGGVSTTPVANFATSFTCVVDAGGKFATGVNDTGSKFAAGVNDTGGKQWD